MQYKLVIPLNKKISKLLKELNLEDAEANLWKVFEDDFDYDLVVASYM
ncbi:MAG: hypothetical protein GW938_15835 [Leptospira sp.]|nr:hypothetical protein [Leptospira sp.]NCS94909.1 hypothetical protein [Leptospira sp.]